MNPVTAVVCGLLPIALLGALPALADGDPAAAALPRPGTAGWVTVVAVVLLQAVGVAWVRRWPDVLLPAVGVLSVVPPFVAPGPQASLTAVGVLAAVFLAVVARPPLRWRTAVLSATAALVALGRLVEELRAGTAVAPATAGAVAQAAVVVGVPLLVGLVVAAQHDVREARADELRAVRGQQEALLAAAMARQRTELSRELHDIAAHHLSGIALAASAIARQVDSDPDAAKRSAGQVREQSRAVLDDLRRLVGLLREDADPGTTAGTGNLAALPALVATYRAAGADVDLSMGDGVVEPGPLAGLVAYRTVQESLTNARTHAPGAPCSVRIESAGSGTDGPVTIIVRNGAPDAPGPGPGGGFGLIGMRERARLVGADVTHGPTPEGGWEVRLALPHGDAVARVGASSVSRQEGPA